MELKQWTVLLEAKRVETVVDGLVITLDRQQLQISKVEESNIT